MYECNTALKPHILFTRINSDPYRMLTIRSLVSCDKKYHIFTRKLSETFKDRLWTYASNFFEESAIVPKVDELLVEEPGELKLQRRVVAHLTWQNHTLPNSDVQRCGLCSDDGWL